MNIDRYMVNLFFEIKRNLPFALQRDFKISNADLGDMMVKLYRSIDDEAIKRLIEVFLERAGDGWTAKLKTSSYLKEQASSSYRGVKKKVKRSVAASGPDGGAKGRYYRGVLVES